MILMTLLLNQVTLIAGPELLSYPNKILLTYEIKNQNFCFSIMQTSRPMPSILLNNSMGHLPSKTNQ